MFSHPFHIEIKRPFSVSWFYVLFPTVRITLPANVRALRTPRFPVHEPCHVAVVLG